MLLQCLFSVYTDGHFVNIEITKGSINVQYNKNTFKCFFVNSASYSFLQKVLHNCFCRQ